MSEPLAVLHAGHRAIVRQNDAHPSEYLFVELAGKTFFLGVLERGMKRRDVEQMAKAWIDRVASP